jgi:integrase
MKKQENLKSGGYIFKRGATYYLQYNINKKRHVKSLRTKDERKAKAKAKKLLDPVIHSNDKTQVIENVAKARRIIQPATLKLEKVWQAYLKTSTDDRPDSSAGTLGNYERNWIQFVNWLNINHSGINYLCDQITEDIAKEYRDYLKNLELADSTFNYKIGSLKLIFRVLSQKAGLNGNVWNAVNRIKHIKQETKKPFTFQQSEELLNTFDKDKFQPMHKEQLKVLFAIGIYSGQRLIDCVNLKWRNIIKFNTGLAIQCKPQKTIKFNKSITAPIVKPLQTALVEAREWEDESGYILPDIAKRYDYNPTGVRKDVIKVFSKAKHVTSKTKDGSKKDSRKYSAYGFHSLRHALFSHLCQKGLTIERLKAWSGDSEKTLLKYYLHAETDKMIEDAQDALNIIDIEPSEPQQITDSEPERQQLIKLVQTLPIEQIRETLKNMGV